jgi:hypothetical protein
VTAPDAHPETAPDALEPTRARTLRTELLIGAALLAGSALLGLLMGLVWHWVAPRVPLYADSQDIYLLNPEGEQSIATDMYFAIIGVVCGLVTGGLAYWRSRAREGGLGVAFGLVLGGLLGGWIAWQLGVALGPSGNIVATAKSVPLGRTFYGPLALTAKGVLLAWPAASLIVLLALSSLFTPKPTEPTAPAEPYEPAAPAVWGAPAPDPLAKPAPQPLAKPTPDPLAKPAPKPEPDGPEAR